MSAYFKKGKGWRYDFTLRSQRYTEAWFPTKKEALKAEGKRREEIENPTPLEETPTAITFLDLVNLRLDYVKAYNSDSHFRDYLYMARRWAKRWGKIKCEDITQAMIERFVLERKKVSPFTANKEIRYLRATFNFGKKRKLVPSNPLDGVDFLPVEKSLKYVPPSDDVDRVIAMADPDTQDYLWAIRETMGRMSEINQLIWDDVNLEDRYVVLYTRKKKGGHRTPRKVPMTQELYEILSRRYAERDPSKPWVFWHTYRSSKTGDLKVGPYQGPQEVHAHVMQKGRGQVFSVPCPETCRGFPDG